MSIAELLESLTHLVQATTRKNQVCITQCLGEIVTRWRINPSPADEGSQSLNEKVFAVIARLLSTVLIVPKNSQLRTESLTVLGKVIKLLLVSDTSVTRGGHSPQTSLVYVFRDEIAKSLDYVIKDLGSDHVSKDTARELKNSLMEISLSN